MKNSVKEYPLALKDSNKNLLESQIHTMRVIQKITEKLIGNHIILLIPKEAQQ